MIFVREKTTEKVNGIKEEQWTMSAKEAILLAKELLYIAEEANDHGRPHHSTMIVEGNEKTMKFKNSKMRFIALPDEKE